jgi:short subunit dehydrogenase-like uncharacterized protein
MHGNSHKNRVLLYGAYGYTGRLTAEAAAGRKLDIVLAGRNQDALESLGARLALPIRAMGLEDPRKLADALKDISTVVHMAGPFAETSAPMLDACLATRKNYIDVTGEIEVFEAIWSRADEIRRAAISVIPGAGFDVVPTDCLAKYVADRAKTPVSLTIALSGLQGVSQGTIRTAIRQISNPVLVRRAGAIVALKNPVPRLIDFGAGGESCVPVSWGDVSTAFHSTGVGDITVYFQPGRVLGSVDRVRTIVGPLLGSPLGQRALAAMIRRLPEGPSQSQRASHRSAIWAQAIDGSGKAYTASLSTPDAYDFTVNSVLEIASRLAALSAPLGPVTPAQAFGADFVLGLPGCSRTDLTTG